MTGGYKILDLKGLDITAAKTIPGIYERVESSVGKPLMVRNYKYNGIDYPAFYTTPQYDSNNAYLYRFSSTSAIVRIVITESDTVRYAPVQYPTSSVSGVSGEDGPSASM